MKSKPIHIPANTDTNGKTLSLKDDLWLMSLRLKLKERAAQVQALLVAKLEDVDINGVEDFLLGNRELDLLLDHYRREVDSRGAIQTDDC